jgi:hypothetical protein
MRDITKKCMQKNTEKQKIMSRPIPNRRGATSGKRGCSPQCALRVVVHARYELRRALRLRRRVEIVGVPGARLRGRGHGGGCNAGVGCRGGVCVASSAPGRERAAAVGGGSAGSGMAVRRIEWNGMAVRRKFGDTINNTLLRMGRNGRRVTGSSACTPRGHIEALTARSRPLTAGRHWHC